MRKLTLTFVLLSCVVIAGYAQVSENVEQAVRFRVNTEVTVNSTVQNTDISVLRGEELVIPVLENRSNAQLEELGSRYGWLKSNSQIDELGSRYGWLKSNSQVDELGSVYGWLKSNSQIDELGSRYGWLK